MATLQATAHTARVQSSSKNRGRWCAQSQCLVNVCGDVVLAVYGPETVTVDDAPTTHPVSATATMTIPPPATAPTAATTVPAPAAAAAAAADSVVASSTGKSSVELNIPEILVHN